ncbi:unnamed protein product [Brassica rapa subsp. trilocularis]
MGYHISLWSNTLEAIAWSRRGLEFWYKRTWPRVLIHRYVDTQICCSWLYTPSDGAPDQKLILNHKLKTSIHQRARKITNQETASTLMKRLYYQECGL